MIYDLTFYEPRAGIFTYRIYINEEVMRQFCEMEGITPDFENPAIAGEMTSLTWQRIISDSCQSHAKENANTNRPWASKPAAEFTPVDQDGPLQAPDLEFPTYAIKLIEHRRSGATQLCLHPIER